MCSCLTSVRNAEGALQEARNRESMFVFAAGMATKSAALESQIGRLRFGSNWAGQGPQRVCFV